MIPYEDLGESRMADGTVFSLHKRGSEFVLKYNGNELMSTNHTYSEQLLAEKGCAHLTGGAGGAENRERGTRQARRGQRGGETKMNKGQRCVYTRPRSPRVLIGGLGLGFTLKRALELVGSPATVEVAELMPPIIEWNRTFLVEHNGPLLEDPRTRIIQGDLFQILKAQPKGRYDALLFDIDNTPDDLITGDNAKLYSETFLQHLRLLLTPGGQLSYWLSEPAPKFKKQLEKAGFEVEAYPAKQRENSKRAIHCLYVCRSR